MLLWGIQTEWSHGILDECDVDLGCVYTLWHEKESPKCLSTGGIHVELEISATPDTSDIRSRYDNLTVDFPVSEYLCKTDCITNKPGKIS
jgi:hypothetical protein